jgi:putative membrane protein
MKKFFNKFKNSLIRFLKGIVIGIAMIIPGVSGGTLAVLLNIYDELIDSINNLFKDFKKSISILLPILIGAGVGFIALVVPISYGLEKCPLIIISLFSGLIIGGIPQLYKKVQGHEKPRSIIFALLSISLLIGLCFVVTNIVVDFSTIKLGLLLYLLLGGFLASCALVVPGISGSMIMMILGLYSPILIMLEEILSFQNLGHNLLIVLPLAAGLVFGFLSIAKLMGFLLKKHTIDTYFSIIGFVVGSIFMIYYVSITSPDYSFDFSLPSILFSCLCLIGGFLLTFLLEKKISHPKEENQNETR